MVILTRTKPSPAKITAVTPFLSCLSLSTVLTMIFLFLGRDRINSTETLDSDAMASFFSRSYTAPLPLRSVVLSSASGNGTIAGGYSSPSSEIWRQPESEGYRPCLDFGIGYRKASVKIAGEKKRFLVVVVSGGLNQQRNQIADAVVIARILEAAIVVPVLQVNLVWGDESEFSEIFDVEHFKKTLESDVRVVSAIPANHFSGRYKIESKIPRDVTPKWIHSRFFHQLTQDGLIVLKGLNSKLTKNLPPDLQKLKCKVAFHALRFAEPIRELGDKLAKRMWIEGPYVALHLRLEKDVWVRTGCRTGLGPEFDNIIAKARESQPELLTGTLNMTYAQRRLAGLCPLNASEIAMLLRALGAKRKTRIYVAGGEPFGGEKAMAALTSAFPNMARKENLARDNELSQFSRKPSAMAAIDYIVSLSSDVFVPSHGGNMGRALMGHRAFVGHRKSVKPNKRVMISLLEDHSVPEARLGDLLREIHGKSTGWPEPRGFRRDRDVIAHPVPECMCKKPKNSFFF